MVHADGSKADWPNARSSGTPAAIGIELGVARVFDVEDEIQRRTKFLKDDLRDSGRSCYVLGISGGIDSTVAGRLAQIAAQQLREESLQASFIAVRLPYGDQIDERDAQLALSFIRPDEVLNVNIRHAADAVLTALVASGVRFDDRGEADFVLGNIKARQRMVVQYAVAGARRGLVIGTDHAAEAVMGFFTKFGDGASDLVPLAGLTKRRVRAIGAKLGAPSELIVKTPTADLESLSPQKPDEEAYGVSYQEIDDYLEGLPVPENVSNLIESAYRATRHKRSPPRQP